MTELEELAEAATASDEAKKAERDGILAKLREEHRFVAWWQIEGHGLVVCRRMRRTESITFTKATSAALKKAEADGDPTELTKVSETLVKTLCVWPKDREALTKIFDEYPDWSNDASLAIVKLGKEAGIVEGKG